MALGAEGMVGACALYTGVLPAGMMSGLNRFRLLQTTEEEREVNAQSLKQRWGLQSAFLCAFLAG